MGTNLCGVELLFADLNGADLTNAHLGENLQLVTFHDEPAAPGNRFATGTIFNRSRCDPIPFALRP
jgi:hypothetical protein